MFGHILQMLQLFVIVASQVWTYPSNVTLIRHCGKSCLDTSFKCNNYSSLWQVIFQQILHKSLLLVNIAKHVWSDPSNVSTTRHCGKSCPDRSFKRQYNSSLWQAMFGQILQTSVQLVIVASHVRTDPSNVSTTRHCGKSCLDRSFKRQYYSSLWQVMFGHILQTSVLLVIVASHVWTYPSNVIITRHCGKSCLYRMTPTMCLFRMCRCNAAVYRHM